MCRVRRPYARAGRLATPRRSDRASPFAFSALPQSPTRASRELVVSRARPRRTVRCVDRSSRRCSHGRALASSSGAVRDMASLAAPLDAGAGSRCVRAKQVELRAGDNLHLHDARRCMHGINPGEATPPIGPSLSISHSPVAVRRSWSVSRSTPEFRERGGRSVAADGDSLDRRAAVLRCPPPRGPPAPSRAALHLLAGGPAHVVGAGTRAGGELPRPLVGGLGDLLPRSRRHVGEPHERDGAAGLVLEPAPARDVAREAVDQARLVGRPEPGERGLAPRITRRRGECRRSR